MAEEAIRELAQGQRLGAEWELQEPLGRGGFGEVWRARHLVFEDRFCAAKIPLDPKCREILRREGIIQHRLEHPHIVKALGLSLVHEPPYFLLELMDGGSLRTAFAKGPLAPRRAWELLWPVLEALEHAHAHGVVHRDVKPENVLLDKHGVPKLTDFGLGRASRELEGVLLSRSFLVSEQGAAAAGTLEYMAPEQRKGREPDPRADIYSFGVILYEALTGERPVGRFPPPSDVRPELPRVFDKVVKRALAPEPERRYAAAAELMSELFRGLADAGVLQETASGPMPRAVPARPLASAPPRPAAPPGSRICPRCREPLKIKLLQGIEVDDCAKCHGIWFDPNELEALVKALSERQPTRETARVARRFLDEYAASGDPPKGTPGVECVICGTPAATFVFSYDDREVRVDRCVEHGAWLDWEGQVALKEVLSTTKGVSTFLEAVRSLFERGGR